MVCLFYIVLVFLSAYSLRAQGEDLNLFTRWFNYAHADWLVRDHLNSVAFAQLQARRDLITGMKSAKDWRRRQAEVRAALSRNGLRSMPG